MNKGALNHAARSKSTSFRAKAFEQCAGFLRIMNGKTRWMLHRFTLKLTLW